MTHEIPRSLEPPFTEIAYIPPTMASRGYRIWYSLHWDWLRGWNARQFSQAYWGEKAQSVLVTGIYLSLLNDPEVDDLLFIVTQTYKHAARKETPEMSSEEKQAFYNHVLEMKLPQLKWVKPLSIPEQEEFLAVQEQVFHDCFITRQVEHGRYYRAFNEVDKYPIEWPSGCGTLCPKCENHYYIGRGIDEISRFPLEEGLDFVNLKCLICGGLFGLRLASPTYRD